MFGFDYSECSNSQRESPVGKVGADVNAGSRARNAQDLVGLESVIDGDIVDAVDARLDLRLELAFERVHKEAVGVATAEDL